LTTGDEFEEGSNATQKGSDLGDIARSPPEHRRAAVSAFEKRLNSI